MSEIQTTLDELTRLANRMHTLREEARTKSQQLTRQLNGLKDLQGNLGDLKDYIDKFADEYQGRVISFVEDLVTKGLLDVFGEGLGFKILSKERANQTTYDFVIVDSYVGTEVDPITAKGGGVVEVTAVLLRVILLYLNRHRLRQILVLDENLSHLALEYVPAMAELLRRLTDKLGIQIILISHQRGFIDAADTVVRMSKIKGKTHIEVEERSKDLE